MDADTDEKNAKRLISVLRSYDRMGYQDAPIYKTLKDALKRHYGVDYEPKKGKRDP